eukprot:04241.XXX_171037_171144_1 [CDS] Oithona nana genome sequencing.
MSIFRTLKIQELTIQFLLQVHQQFVTKTISCENYI